MSGLTMEGSHLWSPAGISAAQCWFITCNGTGVTGGESVPWLTCTAMGSQQTRQEITLFRCEIRVTGGAVKALAR